MRAPELETVLDELHPLVVQARALANGNMTLAMSSLCSELARKTQQLMNVSGQGQLAMHVSEARGDLHTAMLALLRASRHLDAAHADIVGG